MDLELSEHFTPDAWQMLNSFWHSLQERMKELKIANTQQTTILSGIEEFIHEFIEDYKDRERINFERTLELIQEIGSPSEILQAMDLPIEEKIIQDRREADIKTATVDFREDYSKTTQIKCQICEWLNASDSKFCENCGKRIIKQREMKKPSYIPQEAIDHPYIASLSISYLILITLGVVFHYLRNSPSNPTRLSHERFIEILHDIPIFILIPTIIIGLFSGYVIDHSFLEERRSKYDTQLSHFQDYYSLGIILTLISLWLLYVYLPFSINYNEALVLVFSLAFFANGIAIWINKRNLDNRSAITTSYLDLLKFTKAIDNYNYTRIRDINIAGSVVSFVISAVLWSSYDYSILGVTAWIAFIPMLLMLINGIALMNYYSWSHINRFIAAKSLQ